MSSGRRWGRWARTRPAGSAGHRQAFHRPLHCASLSYHTCRAQEARRELERIQTTLTGGDAHTLRAERDTARLELERLRVICDTATAKLTQLQRLQAPPPLHMEQTAADAALTAVEGGVPSLGLAAAGDTETMSREELRMELNVAREAAAGALEELRKTQVALRCLPVPCLS